MLDSNQNQCPSAAMQVSNFYTNNRLDLQKAFAEVQRRASEIGCDNFECSFERFIALATEAKEVTEIAIREAITALQGEMLGFYKDTVRGNYGKGVLGPDFKVILLIWKSKILLVRKLSKLVEGKLILKNKVKILGQKFQNSNETGLILALWKKIFLMPTKVNRFPKPQ